MAQREQTRSQLTSKLTTAGYTQEDILSCLDRLVAQGYQSDARYAHSFVRSAVRKGKGPIRIRYELSKKGVSNTLIEASVQLYETDWEDLAQKVLDKKFSSANMADIKQKAKCLRFMQYRGFSSDHYASFLK